MRIELSIKIAYLPKWGAYEGIRELLQNARDAETEHGAPMTVSYKGGKIIVTNEGCLLNHRDLLLGQTTKSDRADLIGKFGEGLKLGVLALVRAGHAVRIRTGGESWTPSLEMSEVFHEKVLVFSTRKVSDTSKSVVVEIDGVSKTDWATFKKCFLFLSGDLGEHVVSDSGTLLLGAEHKGRVYVRGIFVQYLEGLSYGYDLVHADLDRDRRMVAQWDLRYRLRTLWQEAMGQRPDLFSKFSDMLDNQASDLEGVDEYGATYLPQNIREKVAQTFKDRHGETAVPVATLSESAEIGHLGKFGVVVNKSLSAVLQSIMGTTEEVKENLRKESTKLFSWGEFTASEQANLMRAIALVNDAGVPVSLDDVDVTVFRDTKIQGMCTNGRILIAKPLLTGLQVLLLTLVHELAHKTTGAGDGTKQHVAEIERIWSCVTTSLLPN